MEFSGTYVSVNCWQLLAPFRSFSLSCCLRHLVTQLALTFFLHLFELFIDASAREHESTGKSGHGDWKHAAYEINEQINVMLLYFKNIMYIISVYHHETNWPDMSAILIQAKRTAKEPAKLSQLNETPKSAGFTTRNASGTSWAAFDSSGRWDASSSLYACCGTVLTRNCALLNNGLVQDL